MTNLFDAYPARPVEPMLRACSICMRRGDRGVDLGPADDLCESCFNRAAEAFGQKPNDAKPEGPSSAVLCAPCGRVFKHQGALTLHERAAHKAA